MLRTRGKLEEIEEQILAPYAVLSKNARHQYREPPPKNRTYFQRDWHRITHCEAYRRLDSKTQVFPFGEGDDASRDRLSHTLEVVQIATSLASVLGANEDLVRAIALAHDLGHTPFGHVGENILNTLLKKWGGFDHNRQSLKVITQLEVRYPQFPGLNLSTEVLDGIQRHSTEYDKSSTHLLYFKNYQKPSLEGQIVSLADIIAFRSHDLEDGINMGILKEPREKRELERLTLLREISGEINPILKKLRYKEDYDRVQKAQQARYLINFLITDVLNETQRRIKRFEVNSPLAVRKAPEDIVSFSKGMEKKLDQLKKYLEKNFYQNFKILQMTKKGKDIIASLFETYNKNPEILPGGIQIEIKKRGQMKRKKEEKVSRREETKIRNIVIADYIAGMTDRYAIEQYQKIFEIGKPVL